jgi:dienelactone hydrolase
MTTRDLARAGLAILATLFAVTIAQSAPIEAYGRLPSLEEVSLSPDGSRIAIVALAKMQTDLSDGVRYLVQQGIADPARVGVVGASYGGYAALKHEDQL